MTLIAIKKQTFETLLLKDLQVVLMKRDGKVMSLKGFQKLFNSSGRLKALRFISVHITAEKKSIF